jgi:hypothetical protein
MRIENSGGRAITLCMEPWADEIRLGQNAVLLLTVSSHIDGYLGVDHEPNRVTIHAWSGCTATLSGPDGVPTLDLDIPVPEVPAQFRDHPI